MKKIIIALAVLLSVQFAYAQVKPAAIAKKAVESSEAASKDPKKAAKVATWLKLAKAYMDAYNSPKGNAMNMVGMGVGQQEVAIQLAGEKPLSVENVVLDREPYVKEVYETRLYLYNNGRFDRIVVTKPVIEDALSGALNAYLKAYEVDVKQSKTNDVVAGIGAISENYFEDGMSAYVMGDYATASLLFEKSAEVSGLAPYNKLNNLAYYNAGFTAMLAKNTERAESLFKKCIENEYYHTNGDVFLQLAALRESFVNESTNLLTDAQNVAGQLDFQVYTLEGQIFNATEQIKKIKLNESDLKRVMGRYPKKDQLAQKAKFEEERTALEAKVVKLEEELALAKAEHAKATAVVAKYTEIADTERNAMIGYLEEGFKMFPDNQNILNALITTILSSKQNTGRLFELLDTAKAKDPQNGDYYRIEGDIYRNINANLKGNTEEVLAQKLQNFDNAIKAYDKALEFSSENEDAYIGKGLMYYDRAAELNDRALNEMDNAKYEALAAQSAAALRETAAQFELAYDLVKDQKRKIAIATEIKKIYFRFRSNGGEDEEKYNKYDQIVRQAN